MKNPTPQALLVSLLAITALAAAPEHEAITNYKAYVAAMRAGDVEALRKLCVSVSAPTKPIQTSWIRMYVLTEQFGHELTAQFGPKTDDEEMGAPSDEVLKDLRLEGKGDVVHACSASKG